MTITGKKIVKLGNEECAILQKAIDLLSTLSEEVGNDDYYDFDDIADILHCIRTTDKFEVNFEQ